MSLISVLALNLPAPPRLPASEVFALIAALDPAGIAIAALSGALLAARMRQTFVTMAFFAVVTGVGGGTVRDLLIGAPVFCAQRLDRTRMPYRGAAGVVQPGALVAGGKHAGDRMGRCGGAWRLCGAGDGQGAGAGRGAGTGGDDGRDHRLRGRGDPRRDRRAALEQDRKSTRLNSSHT